MSLGRQRAENEEAGWEQTHERLKNYYVYTGQRNTKRTKQTRAGNGDEIPPETAEDPDASAGASGKGAKGKGQGKGKYQGKGKDKGKTKGKVQPAQVAPAPVRDPNAKWPAGDRLKSWVARRSYKQAHKASLLRGQLSLQVPEDGQRVQPQP